MWENLERWIDDDTPRSPWSVLAGLAWFGLAVVVLSQAMMSAIDWLVM